MTDILHQCFEDWLSLQCGQVSAWKEKPVWRCVARRLSGPGEKEKPEVET